MNHQFKSSALREKDLAAPTPPMGWNSWDCYAATVTEEQLLSNAEYMHKHLQKHGWKYVVCDIQWAEPLAGTEGGHYRPFAELTLDAYGRQMPAENRFPSSKDGKGFKPIADKIHDMGLLFGIHIMRGIPRQAVHARLPILGTDTTADKVANFQSICGWNSDMYGLLPDKPEAQAYYDSLFALYAEWGVDFVKVDDIGNTNLYKDRPYSARKEIELIRKAIDRCGRQMVLSLSPGPAVIEEAWHLKTHANMWRMTDDFWDNWEMLKVMFWRCELWQAHVGNGNWPDCDMLPLGRIGIGFQEDRQTALTKEEQRTMMTLWSIFRSPLMIGAEMNDNDDWTLSLLTNDEVIRVNQAGHTPTQWARTEDTAVWISFGDEAENELFLALFNLSDHSATVSQCIEPFGFSTAKVRDLWEKTDLGEVQGAIEAKLMPHGAKLYALKR